MLKIIIRKVLKEQLRRWNERDNKNYFRKSAAFGVRGAIAGGTSSYSGAFGSDQTFPINYRLKWFPRSAKVILGVNDTISIIINFFRKANLSFDFCSAHDSVRWLCFEVEKLESKSWYFRNSWIHRVQECSLNKSSVKNKASRSRKQEERKRGRGHKRGAKRSHANEKNYLNIYYWYYTSML